MAVGAAAAEPVSYQEARRKGRDMKSEASLVLRLDEVRPGRAMQARRDPISKPSPLITPPTRKTVVTYKVTDAVAKAGLHRWGKGIVFFLAVVLPTLIAGIYYAFIASPQYVSEFRFSVRPNVGAGTPTSAAVDTMLAMSNSYIVSDYVSSRDAAISLDKAVDLRKLYASSSADFLSRLSSDASVEQLVRYWNSRIHTSYDITTGINVVEVSAFSPKDAQEIALALKLLCEKLVNDISEAARKSQMAFAHSELQRAEGRLKEARRQETELRSKQRTIDARKQADGKIELNIKLRGELATLQSEYSVLSQYMNAKSPKLTVLKNQIAATQEQIDQLQSQVVSAQSATGTGGTMLDDAQALAKYDQIQTDLDIATKLYQSSLTNYESSRAQANNSQIYLATYVQPGLAEIASYPRVIFDTCLVFLAAFGIWVVLTLIYYSIRDHV
jgi:capsular polysaccharide transport system permease protein